MANGEVPSIRDLSALALNGEIPERLRGREQTVQKLCLVRIVGERAITGSAAWPNQILGRVGQKNRAIRDLRIRPDRC